MGRMPLTIMRLAMVLGLLFLASSARAQFEECTEPNAVPSAVFETITDQADLDFGDLSDKVCDSIVKKGLSTCKSQVKLAAKCWDKTLDTNYDIQLKQCNQLADSGDRADCKALYKADRNAFRSTIDSATASGLDICANQFAEGLSMSCAGLVVKAGD